MKRSDYEPSETDLMYYNAGLLFDDIETAYAYSELEAEKAAEDANERFFEEGYDTDYYGPWWSR